MPKRVVPEGQGKRVPVMTRTTQELRDRIEQAASASGRSLAQEVENRLQASFETRDLLAKGIEGAVAALFGGAETAELCQRIALTIRHIERVTDKKWHEDAVTKFEAKAGTLELVSKVMQGPEPTKKDYGNKPQKFGPAIGEANAGLVELPKIIVHDPLKSEGDR